MERQLKDTATAVGLNFSLLSTEGVTGAAIELAAAAKRLGLPHSSASQLPFFALHLACLEKGFHVDAMAIQKKSALAPRDYYKSLATHAQILSANTTGRSLQITSLSLSRFYRIPSLNGLLGGYGSGGAVELVAACYLIGQTANPKWKIGSVADLGQLWAVPSADLKAACARLQPAVSMQISQPKELGVLLASEAADRRESATAAKKASLPKSRGIRNELLSASSSSSPFAHTSHPMHMFSCADTGPAFGPLFIQ